MRKLFSIVNRLLLGWGNLQDKQLYNKGDSSMVNNPVAALFLGFIPGFGHLAVGRKVWGFVYFALPLMVAGLGFMLSVAENNEFPFLAGAFIAGIIWAISLLHLVIYLLLRSSRPSPPSGERLGEGSYTDRNAGFQAGGITPIGTVFPTADSMAALSGGGGYPALGQDGNFIPPAFQQGSIGQRQSQSNGAMRNEAASNRGRDDAGERFYAILLSFIPGLGHLQLGLMKRGSTLMIGFFGLIAMILFVSTLANEDSFLVILFVLPIIWLYGMFDAIRHVQLKEAGVALVDRSIVDDWDEHRQGGNRSEWLAVMLSLVPGAGHMYLGLQKRGLQLMAGFLIALYLLNALQLTLLLFIVPLIWCYSFFDGLQLQSRYKAGGGMLEDVPLVDWAIPQQRWIGIGLLMAGLYYIADRILIDYLQRVLQEYELSYELRYYFKTGITALLLLGAGMKLLLGSRSKEGKGQS